MNRDPMLWLLQANDNSYPSGAYAHSFGLEELVELQFVRNATDLENFLTCQIIPALLTFEIPHFAQAHAAANTGQLDALLAVDAELDAWRIPAEICDASRRIGSQRLELLASLAPSPLILDLRAATPRAHHLIVTALELSSLPLPHAARAFAYQALSGLTSSSMKLIRIGQNACQHILHRSLENIGTEIDTAIASPPDGWFNPLLEIASLRHARSNARLFIS